MRTSDLWCRSSVVISHFRWLIPFYYLSLRLCFIISGTIINYDIIRYCVQFCFMTASAPFFCFFAVIEQEPVAQLSWLGVKGRSIPPVSQIHTPPTWTSAGGSLFPGAFWWNYSSPTWPFQETPAFATRTSWSSLMLTPPWVSFHHAFMFCFVFCDVCVLKFIRTKKKPTCRSRSCLVEISWIITSVNCK